MEYFKITLKCNWLELDVFSTPIQLPFEGNSINLLSLELYNPYYLILPAIKNLIIILYVTNSITLFYVFTVFIDIFFSFVLL